MKIHSLFSLKLDSEEIELHRATMIYRNITKVGDDYFFIKSDYLRTKGEFTPESIALVCSICSPFIKKNQRPPLSIASGMDFGRPCIRAEDAVPGSVPPNMPILALRNLSLIEKLCISASIIYKMMIKFVSTKSGAVIQYGLTGHAIAVPTNAADRMSFFLSRNPDGPRKDIHSKGIVSVTLLGQWDKWKRLTDGPNGAILRSTYGSIFTGTFLILILLYRNH
jgi:hypothetical protein